ncbi:MAG: hypothetical protein RR386_00100 [Bacteroidaceae bacterium]
MQHNYYKIADLIMHLCFVQSQNEDELIHSFRPFAYNLMKDEPAFTSIIIDPTFVFNEERTEIGQFDCGGANHGVYSSKNGDYQIEISNNQGFLCGKFQTNATFTQTTIVLYGDIAQQSFALNNCTMLVFAFSASSQKVLLMHSSVIQKEGRGYLFQGKSGTGKSTHSRMWLQQIPNTELLNDDNPAVRVINGCANVYGTPWSGKTPCYRNASVPIGAFVRIEQQKENKISKHRPVEAFASILSSCSTMLWDKRSYHEICDTVSFIASHTNSYTLGCLPNSEAANLCFSTVSK